MITNKIFDEIEIGESASMQRTLTKQDIDLFGVCSSDMDPTHFSDEYAQMLLKRHKLVGHSMWGASLLSSLLGNKLPGPGTVYESQKLEFHGAVEMDDTLTIMVTVKDKVSSEGSVIFDCLVTNQRQEKIITGEAKVKAPIHKPTEAGSPYAFPENRPKHGFPKHAFRELIDRAKGREPILTAVCHPCNQEALKGAIDAAQVGLIEPIMVGPQKQIRSLAEQLDLDISAYRLVDTNNGSDSGAQAVALCRQGEAEALMKGSLHTDELLRAVINRDTGLRTATRLSHVTVLDIPTYQKPLFVTDAAINIYPTLEDKVNILKNAIQLAHALGISQPKVAILSAVETVTRKITSTLEAAALCKMADRRQIKGAIIDGPLAFDNAISKEAAVIKGIDSPVSGEADILLVPDMESGNILVKQLGYLANAEGAALVLGARVPIILTSRASSTETSLASFAVATAFAYWQRQEKIITGEAKVKTPIHKPTEAGLPFASLEIRPKHAFRELIDRVKDREPVPTAICHPCSQEALKGAINAAQVGLIEPILVGPQQQIRSLAEQLELDISAYRLVDTNNAPDSGAQAVALCRQGEAEVLMKGSLHTDELISAVTNRDRGLGTGTRISHVAVLDVPTYNKLLFVTDAAINIYPTLEDKVDILKNAIQLAHALGISQPKVAILSGVETVTQKITSTLEAAALCKMADRRQIKGAIIDGPLAFDNAISRESAVIKGIDSPVSGEADILLVPDMESGNILVKQLGYLANAEGAGLVLGARVPIVFTSRSASPEGWLASFAVAVAFAYWRRQDLRITQ